MNQSTTESTPREWLRNAFVICVWGLWLPFSGAWWLLRRIPALPKNLLDAAHARSLRPSRLLWGIPCLVLAVVLVQLAPLVYGRFAILDEAQNQAKTSYGRESGELVGALRMEAFRLGFTDIIHQDGVFSIESGRDEDGESLCIVDIQIRQKLKLLGCIPMDFSVRKRVSSVVTQIDFKEKRRKAREFIVE